MHQDITTNPPPNNEADFWGLSFAFLMFVWAVVLMILPTAVFWVTNQIFIIESATMPWTAAPTVHAFQAMSLLVPLFFLSKLWTQPRYQAVFHTWFLTALYFLFLLPVRLAPYTAAHTAATLQILCSLGYLVALTLYLKHNNLKAPTTTQLGCFPLLVPFLLISWLGFGALGSLLDTILNGTAALLFALIMAQILIHVLYPALQRTETSSKWNITLGGYAGGLALFIASTGFGANGAQILLMVTLPATAWLLVVLSLKPATETTPPQWHSRGLVLALALMTAAPLTLFDPDELVLILSGRDTIYWATAAVFATVMGGWLGGIVATFGHDTIRQYQPTRVLIISIWAALMPVYFIGGQPGFHGEQLFVIFEAQADLSSATTMTDYDTRRQFVYTTLTSQADASQADMRTTLDRLRIDYTAYYLVNALAVDANPLLRVWLTRQPGVDRVIDNPALRPLPLEPNVSNTGDPLGSPTPRWNLTMIGAPAVWADFDVRGQGIVIGQSDSGVQGDHPEVSGQYRGRAAGDDYNWFDPWYQTAAPQDWGGHGTHTLGTILGQSVGVAPDAEWFGCSNLARNLANPAYYLDCLQFMLAPFPQGGDPFRDGDATRSAHVLNNSWGCPPLEGCDPTSLQPAVAALRAAGIFVVVSAGNDGTSGCETVQSPLAIYDEVFSVGAVAENGELASFSSKGPVTVDGSGRIKPDIIAPGVDVFSSVPLDKYAQFSGTSMAGPHVVGVVALMWSAQPALIGDIETTEQIIIDTAAPFTGRLPTCALSEAIPNNAVGYGLIDAHAAVTRALAQP